MPRALAASSKRFIDAELGTCGASESASPGPASLKICQLSRASTPSNFCTSRLLRTPPGVDSNMLVIDERSFRRTSAASTQKVVPQLSVDLMRLGKTTLPALPIPASVPETVPSVKEWLRTGRV